MTFQTESGSVYVLDKKRMTWTREGFTPQSGEIRSEQGKLVRWPKIEIGERAFLFDTSVREGFHGHAVVTSLVTQIWRES